jgi:hypothetical protein
MIHGVCMVSPLFVVAYSRSLGIEQRNRLASELRPREWQDSNVPVLLSYGVR